MKNDIKPHVLQGLDCQFYLDYDKTSNANRRVSQIVTVSELSVEEQCTFVALMQCF